VSEYLALAKKANRGVPTTRKNEIKEPRRFGCEARWSKYPMWIEVHDPTTGEWHELKATECLPGIVAEADRRRREG
jgi:hypothetical protein